MRNAQITAAALEVLCPYCGEPQPDPERATHMWDHSQVVAQQGAKVCTSCDKTFRLVSTRKAQVY
jgi:uncharacterized Zn-finger protein